MKKEYNLYNAEKYIPFNFSEWKMILKKYNVDGILRGNYIMLASNLKPSYTLLPSLGEKKEFLKDILSFKTEKTLAEHSVFFGRVNDTLNISEKEDFEYHSLIWDILKLEIFWLKSFFKDIHNYLDKRISDGKALMNHESMRILMAEIVGNIKLIDSLLILDFHAENTLCLANLVQVTAKKLANCSGGRGFTGGNILEFFWLITLMNNFLLGDIKHEF